MDKTAHIFKIFTQAEWGQFQQNGVFEGSALDKSDGFIHISAGPQLQGTLDKWYTNGAAVVIAAIDPANLEAHLKWEVSRDGAEFPHYYAPLEMAHIEAHYDLSPDAQGRYDVTHII